LLSDGDAARNPPYRIEGDMPRHLVKRDGYWRFCRRVPQEFAELDKRGIVQQSTKIRVADDTRGLRASEVAHRMNSVLEDYWQSLLDGNTGRAGAEYEAARRAARRMRISPPIEDAAQRTIAELLVRIEKLMADQVTDRASVQAVYDAAPAPPVTFRQAAERFIDSQRPAWSNARHAVQWTTSLAQHVYPTIGNVPVAELNNSRGTDLVMQVLEPIWGTKTETASRVRGRIEKVLDWAKVRGFRDGENPARWRGHLDKLLPAPGKVASVKHHAAMPYEQVPAFMVKLREDDGIAARALEFAILTAARTAEVLGAKRAEIDRKTRIWMKPPERMKARKEHRVPLSDAALSLIDRSRGEFLFPGKNPGTHLTHNMLRTTLRKLGVDGAAVHGFRSSFRDWGSEVRSYPSELLEMALAHTVGNKVEAAYRRGDMLEKRHQLMADWAQFCNSAISS
jgi:integrase